MEELTYEAAMARLSEIVKSLENGGKGLDESVKLFEEGARLSKFCSEKLNNAEQKIISIDEEGSSDD